VEAVYINSKFDFPLPKINTIVDEIYEEVDSIKQGYIKIENVGGGILEGKISSNSNSILFMPDEFVSNNIKIAYNINVSMYSKGEIVKTEIIISSNGGEKIIPINIKVIENVIHTKEGIAIKKLDDFLNYSKQYSIEARRLLCSNDFMIWLKNINFADIDIVESLINDSNKERALDNFLILCKLKKRAFTTSDKDCINIKINDYNKREIEGKIKLYKNGWGYIDDELFIKNNSDWLSINKNKITSKDFDDNNEAEITYYVNVDAIKTKYEKDSIVIKGTEKREIKFWIINESLINVKITKMYFDLNDTGFIEIENNTKESELTFEIISDENCVKFEGYKYRVGKYAKIPFNIKVSGIQKAQNEIFKKPFIDAKIYIKTTVGKNVLKYEKKIRICDTII